MGDAGGLKQRKKAGGIGWQDECKDKLVTVEEAAGVIKSGNKVAFCMPGVIFGFADELAKRKDELRGNYTGG